MTKGLNQWQQQVQLLEKFRPQLSPDAREKRTRTIAKYFLIIGFMLLVADILAQQATYPVGNIYGIHLAYLAVPFFVFSVFLVVYAYSYRFVKAAWQSKSVRLFSLLAGAVYGAFYLFVTNMVSNPDVPMPPNLQGFVLPLQVYDHLAVWPDVEFWSPRLNLVGYFSVGSVLVVFSLGALTAFSVALLFHNISMKKSGSAAFAGSFLTSLSTNACCCCVPVILPALFAVFGLGTSGSLAEDFTFQTMPVFNLLWVGSLLFLLMSIILSSQKKNGSACNR